MREIKFRAWDKEEKAMRIVSGVFFPNWPCREEYVMKTPTHVDVVLPSSRFELMQFTGLKDKNGVDIYEGDIVKMSYHREESGIFQVVWDQHRGEYNAQNEKERNPFLDYPEDFEIIGNIYSNPDLLK